MTVHHTPWHALTVTEVWYCEQADSDAADMPCRDEDGWCTGHGEAASGLHVEIKHDLTHPAECESRPDFLDCLTADMACDNRTFLPSSPGAYRLRAWMHMPGESLAVPPAGLECELASTGGAS